MTRDGAEVATLARGDFFGEIAIVEGTRRTATVTASSPLTYAALFGADFRMLERDLPVAAARIRDAIAERLARTPG